MQERTDDQGDVAQDPQIPAKSRHHAPVLIRSASLRTNLHAFRQGLAQALLPCFQRRMIGHANEHAIDATGFSKLLLSLSDVHDDDVLAG